MECFNCNQPLPEQAKFCTRCGMSLAEEEALIDLYNEGYSYYHGSDGYPQNYQKALECFTRASARGHLEATNYIGLLYLNGTGVMQNTPHAIEWFCHALKICPTFGRAYYNLGCIFYEGTAAAVDYNQAFYYLNEAIRFGKNETYYAIACHYVGYILFIVQRKPKDSIPYFQEAIRCNEDLPEAWYNLGVLSRNGHLKDKAPFYYFQKAAYLGYADAMDEVGRLYIEASLRVPDSRKGEFVEKAYTWLQRGAKKGSKNAAWRMKWLEASDLFLSLSHSYSSSSSSYSSSNYTTNSSASSSSDREFTFYDGAGNYAKSGQMFYDFRGNPCEWGSAFYDSKGNYCTWGSPFYDGRGNLCEWGAPFYDSKGNYIAP